MLLKPLMHLYPGTDKLYWAFLSLNLSSQLGYLIRDSYRNETVIPNHRYIDYDMKGVVGVLVTTMVYEITHRIQEALYMAPMTARKSFAMHEDLSKTFRNPLTLDKPNSQAKNIATLTKVPELLKRMSGSFGNPKANPELANNLIEELLNPPKDKAPIPMEQRPAVLQFWKNTNYFQAHDANRDKMFDDYLKMVVDKNNHNPELVKYFQKGAIKHLPTEQLNVLRDALLQHQLTMKLLKDVHTEKTTPWINRAFKGVSNGIQKVAVTLRMAKPPKAKEKGLDTADKIKLFRSGKLQTWLDNEIAISKQFDERLKTSVNKVPNHNWLDKDPLLKKLDKHLKDKVFSKFNYIVDAEMDPGDGDKAIKRKILNPYLAENKLNNLKHIFNLLKKEVSNAYIPNNQMLTLNNGAEGRITNTLYQFLEKNTGANAEDLSWLKRYLDDGLKAFKGKKWLSRMQRHNFWLKMAAVVGIQFFTLGVFTTYLDVSIAQPLQKRLTAEGIRPDKVARWPVYSAIIPGLLTFTAMSSNKLFGALPGVSKVSRLGRMVLSSLVSSAVMAAWMIKGVNRNVKYYQKKMFDSHSAHRPLPPGYREESLLQVNYNNFSTQKNPAIPQQQANPFVQA